MYKFLNKHKLIKDLHNLEEANLPDNAVMFKESKDVEAFIPKCLLLAIVVTIIFVTISKVISDIQGVPYIGADYFTLDIVALWIVQAILHEYIHAVCYGKNADVKIYISLNNGVLVCHSTKPLEKKRFILMSIAPTLIFAVIPYVFWAVFFVNMGYIGTKVLSYCAFPFIFGVGDYINIVNTIRQVPKGGFVVNSGFHSYWFHQKE